MGEFPDFVVGGLARDGDFFFRREFIDDLWEALRKEHVLLLAPRRMGKTSVMVRLQEEPRQERLVVFLNIEEVCTPAEFCQRLLVAIYEQQTEYFRRFLATAWEFLSRPLRAIQEIEVSEFKLKLREAAVDWEERWQVKADELVTALRRTERPLLLILDELPDMVLNMHQQAPGKVAPFLHWFRGVRQNPRQDNIRWLIGGSVNLRSTLDRQGRLNLINDLHVEPLSPFTDAEVREFVETMLRAHGVPFAPEAVDRVRELLGEPIPFFLQLLTQELYRDWRAHRQSLTPEHVTTVFQSVLLGEVARDKLQHFRSRITTHYSADEKAAALELLDHLSRSDVPLSRQALLSVYTGIAGRSAIAAGSQDRKQGFDDLLVLLHNDFYVEEVGEGQYDFASRILKLWWRKYYA